MKESPFINLRLFPVFYSFKSYFAFTPKYSPHLDNYQTSSISIISELCSFVYPQIKSWNPKRTLWWPFSSFILPCGFTFLSGLGQILLHTYIAFYCLVPASLFTWITYSDPIYLFITLCVPDCSAEFSFLTVLLPALSFHGIFTYTVSSLCDILSIQNPRKAYTSFIFQLKHNFQEEFLSMPLRSNQNIIGKHKPYTFPLSLAQMNFPFFSDNLIKCTSYIIN